MLLRRIFKLLLTSLVIALIGIISCSYLWPSTIRAETIQIFATVAADAFDFQLELDGPEQPGPHDPNSVLTYTLTYGSYLSTPTDMIVIQVTWSQAQSPNNQELVDLLEYVEGSATPALGNAQPVIDLVNRTITWQISPMPSSADQVVSWQLRTKSLQLPGNFTFSISASLIGPGLEKQASPLSYSYAYTAPTPTPTLTPSPTVTPTSPGDKPPSSGSNLLDQLGPLITNIINVAESIAKDGGSLVVVPIPLLFVLVPAIAQIVTLLSQVPWWQIIPLLAALFWSRPRKPWGVVYDSATKQPIDPAIITLTNSRGEERTTLSDFYGRYQFIVEPGTYELTVKKVHYLFPSQLLNGRKDDGVYEDLYFGGKITINDADAITYNIPLDPVAPDWNQNQKRRSERAARRQQVWQWLFWIGLAWSIIMCSVAASLLNIVVLGMYIILLLLRWLQRLRSPWGTVYNQQGQPIAGAAVSLADVNNPLVKRPPVVTNSNGRYAFLVDKGRYQLNVALKSGETYSAPTPGPVVEIKSNHGHITTDLTVENTDQKA